MQKHNRVTSADDEINLFEMIGFLSRNWKIIVGTCGAGIAVAAIFIAVAPKQYEADALISVAQMFDLSNITSNNNNNNNSIQTISAESPALLIERLKKPTTYTAESIKACGLEGQQTNAEAMANLIQAGTPKTLNSLVDITVRRNNPDLAKQCAEAVFSMIREQEDVILKPYQKEMNDTLKELQSRLDDNNTFIAKMEKAGLYQTVYLAKRDESLYLTQQISKLKRFVSFNNQTRLVAPVYAPAKPVYPVRSKALVLGSMAGLLLGLLIALARQVFLKLRSNAIPG